MSGLSNWRMARRRRTLERQAEMIARRATRLGITAHVDTSVVGISHVLPWPTPSSGGQSAVDQPPVEVKALPPAGRRPGVIDDLLAAQIELLNSADVPLPTRPRRAPAGLPEPIPDRTPRGSRL